MLLSDFLHGVDGLFQTVRLPSKDAGLQQQDKQGQSGDGERHAIAKALVGSFFCFTLGFLGIIRGCERLDDKRRFRSAALIFGGGLLYLCGSWLIIRMLLWDAFIRLL